MLREILARFGIRVNLGPLKKAATRIRAMVSSLKGMAGILAAGFLVRGLKNFITGMIGLGDEIAKTSRALGVSGDELLAWRFAAERSGVDAGQLGAGFKRLQRNIVDANQNVATAVRAFRALGVEWKDLATGDPRELLDIMPDLADGFGRLTTDSERSARAQELFGRAGANLLPFFENGSEGIQKLLGRFQELTGGQGFGEFLKQSEAAQDGIADFDLTVFALKTTIAVDVLPAITDFLTKTAELFTQIRTVTADTELWKVAMIAVGAVAAAVGIAMVAAFIQPIAIVAAIALGIFLLILAVEDFVGFMDGKDSVIGRILESWGVDTDLLRDKFLRLFEDQRNFWTNEFPAFIDRSSRNLSNLGDDMVRLWGKDGIFFTAIRPAFTAFADFVAGIVTFIIAEWDKGVARVTGGIDLITRGIRGAAGFLGIDIGGTAPEAGGPAAGPLVTSAAGVNIQTNQTVQVDVDARGADDPDAVGAAVQNAIATASTTNLRNAQRALVNVAG